MKTKSEYKFATMNNEQFKQAIGNLTVELFAMNPNWSKGQEVQKPAEWDVATAELEWRKEIGRI